MSISFSERTYEFLLHALPHDFRAEYGSEMRSLFRRRARDRNFAFLWMETIADVASTAAKEHCHMLFQDLSYTLRTLRRAPVFAAAAILTLALGVGANTAIFSVIHAVMLRPLPYRAPDRLVRIWETNPKRNIQFFSASGPDFLSWREQSTSFTALGAFGGASLNLTGAGEPERLAGGTLSPSVFPLLGIHPIAGRSFLDEEEQPGGARVVIIGEALWRRRFGGDPAIVGRSVELNGVNFQVVGIAPPELQFPANAQMWIPLRTDRAERNRGDKRLSVIGRLKDGVSLEQAQSELKSVAANLEKTYAKTNEGWTVRMARFYDWIVPDRIRKALLVLLGAVGLVLLTSCVNVANLLLARAVARSREIAVRLAVGAGRRRIARQLLTESALISLLGGMFGALLAWWAVTVLKRLLADSIPRSSDIRVDAVVLGFALATSLVTGLLFGIAPLYQALQGNLSGTLQEGSRATAGGRLMLRRGLVAFEIAMATMLVIGASLLVQSFSRLGRAQLGFRPDHLLTAQISLPPARYAPPAQAKFYEQLLERLRAARGLEGAAISSGVPMGAGDYTSMSGRANRPDAQPGELVSADWRMVDAGYFKTMGIPVLRGRTFGPQDLTEQSNSIIISASYARRLYGDVDPVGSGFKLEVGPPLVIAGVVGDVRLYSLEQEPTPAMYFPAPLALWQNMTVVLRTAGNPAAAAGLLRAAVRELDPRQPVYNIRTMDQWVDNSSSQARANALLLTIFGCVALLLAAVGVYGVLSYAVTQRTNELGVRIALGATAPDIMRLVLSQGMMMAVIGLAAGAGGALALRGVVKTVLFEISPQDVRTFVVVMISLGVVSLAACALPAWRAGRIDPLRALRQE